jgi:hypothetical protein
MSREMTLKDYEKQRKIILSDRRYTSGLKEWLLEQLLSTFEDINDCSPGDMRKDQC